MAGEKGVCQKHGTEFILTQGCPLCLAEKRGRSITESSTALVTKPGEDAEVVNYYEQALKLREYAESRVIKTVEDMKTATDDLSIISRLKKAMGDKRREYLLPLQEKIKAINDNYKLWMVPIEAADKITRDKILAFNREQERIRQEQEEVNRLRMEAAQKEAALKGGEISKSVDLVEVTSEPPRKVSTEMGTAGMVDNWKWEVTDFAAVPDAYKVIDSSQLTAIARKHHDRKLIPGVRFYNEPTLRVSPK